MFDELFPDARAASLSQQVQRPERAPDQPGIWKGFGGAVADALPYAGQTTASAWSSILDAYGNAAAYRDTPTNALVNDEMAPTPEALRTQTLDQMGNSETARMFRERAKRYAPDPAAVGLAGQVAHGLVSGLAKMTAYAGAGPAGPALFGMDSGINRAQELTDQGVDGGTAAAAGLVTGVASAATMALPPALGATRLKSAAIGAVAAPAMTVAEVGGIRTLLEHADYDKIAAQYQPFDPMNLAISSLTGAAFGGAFHRSRDLTPQQDYKQFLNEFGLTEDAVRRISENTTDQIPMPPGTAKIQRRASSVEGEGMFATEAVQPGELLAPARIGGMRTPAGRYTNHSNKPNAEFRAQPNGDLGMVATQPITHGAEVVIDYRQAAEANGWGGRGRLTPDEHAALLTMNEVRIRDGDTLTAHGDLAAAADAHDAQALARQQLDRGEMVSIAQMVRPDVPTLDAARAMAFERMTTDLRAELIAEAGGRAEAGDVANMAAQRAELARQIDALQAGTAMRDEAKAHQKSGLSRKQAEAAARKSLPEKLAELEEQAKRLDRQLEQNRNAARAEQDLARLDQGALPDRFLEALNGRADSITRGFQERPIAQGVREALSGEIRTHGPTDRAPDFESGAPDAPAGILDHVRQVVGHMLGRQDAGQSAPVREGHSAGTPEHARAAEIVARNPDALIRLEDGSEVRMADLLQHAESVEATAKTEKAAFEAAVTCALRFPQ